MAIFTTAAASITALFGTTALILRHRISRNWINVRKNPYDLSGKTIIITGGNVGLGYEAAKDFSNRNANVVLACRNVSKGSEAASSITKATGDNGKISSLELDLASLDSVKSFISTVQSKYPVIDVVVCNAGVWFPMDQEAKTKDGFEIHFGVNHLSHLLIAKSLVPQLEKANGGDGRIVFVSSSLMKSGKIDFESAIYEGRKEISPEGQRKKSHAPTGYCDSKLMNALTCKYMASILPPTVTTYSVCPGFCRSSLGRNVSFPFFLKLVATPIMFMIQRTAVQGAQNIVFVASESKDELENGKLYRDGKVLEEQMAHMDNLGGDRLAKKVWDLSNDLLKKT